MTTRARTLEASNADARELYRYQKVLMERVIRLFRRGHRDVLLHAPCGAGKTLLGKAFAAWCLRSLGGFQGFHTVIVCAPLNTIVESWGADENVVFKQEHGALSYTAVRLAEHKKGQSPAAFWDDFWARSFKSTPTIFVCSRAQLTHRFCMEALERAVAKGSTSVQGFLLQGDEAHHHATDLNDRGGNKAGEFVRMLLKGGGAFLGSTATPWSASGEIIREGTEVVPLPLLKYQMEIDPETGKPFAPQHWEALPIITGYETDDETLAVENRRKYSDKETDAGVSSTLQEFAMGVVPEYVARWVADGCRKVVMRARTVAAAALLVEALAKSKKARAVLGRAPRILNLSGNMSREDKTAAQAILNSEARVRAYADSQVDVIVAVVRMDEGTDWRLCSDVYTTGIPGSVSFDIQLCSRAGRGKGRIKGYPAHSENTQRMFYFLPKLDEEKRAKVLLAYSDLMIAKALLLQSLEAGLSVINTNASISLTPKRKRSAKEEATAFDHEVTAAEHAGAWHGDVVQNSMAFAKVVKTLARMGDSVTIAQVNEVIEKASEGLSEEAAVALRRGAMEHLKAKDPALAEAWARAERSFFKSNAGYRAPSIIRADVMEEWRRFVAEHGEKVCPTLDDVLEKAAGFSGGTCEEMVGAWGAGRFPWPMTCEETTALALKHGLLYKDKHGVWPSRASGRCETLDGRPLWASVCQALRRFGSCLPVALGNPPQRARARVNAQAIRDFIDKNGRDPTATTKDQNERRLGRSFQHLRYRHPDLCAEFNLSLAADRSLTMRHALAKAQFSSLGEVISLFARNFPCDQSTEVIEGETGCGLQTLLRNARLRAGASRGLGYAPDLCQVNSIARANYEIEHDCWRFTLKGAKKPDSRKWSAILACGDNVKIGKAERVAVLDWETPDRGAPRVGHGGAQSPATRRPWTPPAAQPSVAPAATAPAGKRKSAKVGA